MHTPFPFPINRIAGISREIKRSIKPPVHILAYKDGGVYSLFIEHPALKILVCGSGGFVEGELNTARVDTVFLCVGGLDLSSRNHRERYIDEMAGKTGARRVFFTHWDDFSRPLTEEGRLAPWTKRSAVYLTRLAEKMGVKIGYMPRGKKFTL